MKDILKELAPIGAVISIIIGIIALFLEITPLTIICTMVLIICIANISDY